MDKIVKSTFEIARSRLVDRLRAAESDKELNHYHVVALNDFSLDRIIEIKSFDDFEERARVVLARGGGLLPNSIQSVQQGGCAANTATTLGCLGIETYFITKTDAFGKYLLDYFLQRNGVNIDHVKLNGQLALAACIEVGSAHSNIMINDKESFTSFSYQDLEPADLALIESADIVGIFDWSLNQKGTDLASGICNFLSGKGKAAYLDTSDPAPRKDEIPELFRKVFTNKGLSYLNLNENELCQYQGVSTSHYSIETYIRLMKELRKRIHADLNVHTTQFSMNIEEREVVIPSFHIVPRRSTGCGDAWNGGNILGYLLNLTTEERLMLANAVAGFYSESIHSTRPSVPQLISFLQDEGHQFHKIEKLTPQYSTLYQEE